MKPIARALIVIAAAMAVTATIAATAAQRAAADRDARMAWWRDARFGMFIHWGLYAVPAGEY